MVSTGTVTAQLLYEISSPAYINPDVIANFDTLKIEQESNDRVYVSGCKGSSPPDKHKVCINLAGGFRNGIELLLTGLDIEEKADLIALGRQHLFNPFWTNQARERTNQNKDFMEWPQQYRWWLSKWKSALSDINEKP